VKFLNQIPQYLYSEEVLRGIKQEEGRKSLGLKWYLI